MLVMYFICVCLVLKTAINYSHVEKITKLVIKEEYLLGYFMIARNVLNRLRILQLQMNVVSMSGPFGC